MMTCLPLKLILLEFLENNDFRCVEQPIHIRSSTCHATYEHVVLTPTYDLSTSRVFRWFRNAASAARESDEGSALISEMIIGFRKYRGTLHVALRETILNEAIVETCHQVRAEDNLLVKQVLDVMYESWSSFGPLHFTAIAGRRRHRKPGLLSYYLEHARRSKAVYGGQRMVDVSIYSSVRKSPVFLAADLWSWKKFRTYLQFGARIYDGNVPSSVPPIVQRDELKEAVRKLLHHLWVRIVQPSRSIYGLQEIEEFCNSLALEHQFLCQTMNVLLRAVRRLKLQHTSFMLRDYDGESVIQVPSWVVLNNPIVQKLIPMLMERCQLPASLQHECRLVIRQRLNDNWQLPAGIRSLNLPPKLKQYLNLITG